MSVAIPQRAYQHGEGRPRLSPLAGHGVAFVPKDRVREHIRAGRLIRALAD